MNHSTDVLYPPNSVASHCPKKDLLCPTSIVYPYSPHASVSHIIKPPFAIDSGCGNILKVTKDHHPCTNSKKRPLFSFVDPPKPNKLPNIEVQKNFSHMIGLARETVVQICSETQGKLNLISKWVLEVNVVKMRLKIQIQEAI